jgi:molybdate transport system substrate-binding protein
MSVMASDWGRVVGVIRAGLAAVGSLFLGRRLLGRRLAALALTGFGLAMLVSLTSCRSESKQRPLRVAVAANFAAPLERIAASFTAAHQSPVELTSGSTGKLATQIENGAPFDLYLAADERRPRTLHAAGLAEAPFVYAVGRLALVGSRLLDPADGRAALLDTDAQHIAIANPELAPYGAAALATLGWLGLRETLEPRLVYGENVAQALHFVRSGGAELGLVPESLARSEGLPRWSVPSDAHEPIRQAGVVLTPRSGGRARHPAASAFVAHLSRPEIRALIHAAGYDSEAQ